MTWNNPRAWGRPGLPMMRCENRRSITMCRRKTGRKETTRTGRKDQSSRAEGRPAASIIADEHLRAISACREKTRMLIPGSTRDRINPHTREKNAFAYSSNSTASDQSPHAREDRNARIGAYIDEDQSPRLRKDKSMNVPIPNARDQPPQVEGRRRAASSSICLR